LSKKDSYVEPDIDSAYSYNWHTDGCDM